MPVAPTSSTVISVSASAVHECEEVDELPETEEPLSRLAGSQPLRGALVARSLLLTVCGGALLMTAAAVLDPSTLQASSTPVTHDEAQPDEQQQRVANALTSLLWNSKQVLAAHNARDQRGAEVLLWLHDEHDVGRTDADEIALVRHNALFQTITVYSVAPKAESGSPQADGDLAAPDFLDRWRAQADVKGRVIATGISDFQIESAVPSALSPLRLHLTWPGDSADGGMHASNSIEVTGRYPSPEPMPTPQQEYHP
jgi:hypothetical protein